jgi:hypothetical protein
VTRLLNQANTGDYEQHLRAVKELSKLVVSDSEFCQLAQVEDRHRLCAGVGSRLPMYKIPRSSSSSLPLAPASKKVADVFKERKDFKKGKVGSKSVKYICEADYTGISACNE